VGGLPEHLHGDMGYLIERQRVLRVQDVVAVMRGQQRRLRSRVICADNSLYQTLTRPTTLMRYFEKASRGFAQVGARGPRAKE